MKINTKNMILTAFFAGLTAIGAIFLVIPVGPVPITLQLFFTALSGIVLGARLGALSQIVYVLMGLVGLPVFAGGVGGPAYIFSPSFGYLIGFIIGAYVIGKISERKKEIKFYEILISTIIGVLVIYAIGFPYLYIVLTKINNLDVTFYSVLKNGVLLFIPGDIIKCILTAVLGKKIIPIIKNETVS